MILLRSFLRPGLRRLAWFRSALRAPVICSPSSCVGQESRLLKPACRSAQTPSGVFLFSGRFAPSSQRVAAFRPPLWLNLICPAQAPAKSDSAAAPGLSSQAWIVARFSRVAMLPSVSGRGIPLWEALDKLRGGCSLYWMENSSPR